MKVVTKRIKRNCVKCDKRFSTDTKIKIVGGIIPVREDKFLECENCREESDASIDKIISSHFSKLGKKSWESRKKKLLEREV